jgi:flagellar basal-body rod protein FlgG
MLRALMTAASGMKAQQMQVDTIANNIANVNTHGFKQSRLSFRSLLYETMREPGAPSASNAIDASGLQIGTGTEVAGSMKVFKQGDLEQTGGPLDLAIQGEGFFAVQLPNGELRYTRSGSFRRDETGQIMTSEGYRLANAPAIPADSVLVVVAEDGTIASTNREDEIPGQLGQIQITRFANPAGLKAQGGNYFSPTASSGQPQQTTATQNGAGSIHQGYLERSNVATVDELVALIVAQRNYEVNSRAIRVSDEMLQQVNQLVR